MSKIPTWRLLLVVVVSCLVQTTHSFLVETQRNLQQNAGVGDFEELNQLLRNVVIRLPDVQVSRNLLTVDIRNLKCQEFEVDNVQVNSSKSGQDEVTMDVTVQALDLVCNFDFDYTGLLVRGSASAQVVSNNNNARAIAVFSSSSPGAASSSSSSTAKSALIIPTESTLESCDTQININDMNFEGGALGLVLDQIEGLLRSTMERIASGFICDELKEILTEGYVAELLELVDKTVELYPPEAAEFDALELERQFNSSTATNLVNFQHPETELGHMIDMALQETFVHLGKEVDMDNGFGETDLNINVLLRDSLDEGAYMVNISDLPLDMDGVVWYVHDNFTETTVTLNQVQLVGLDSFTQFDPLVKVGNYTFQNELSWDKLQVEMDITLDIKPSTLENSLVEFSGTQQNIVERVQVKFGLEEIQAAASFLLAIDQDALDRLVVGNFLEKDHIIPCILSTIVHAELSGFTVQVNSIIPPTLDNFVSPGLDRILTSLMDAAFLMYHDALVEALPSIFQTTVREMINKAFMEQIQSQNGTCTFLAMSDSPREFVDWQLLLKEVEPYGDLVSTVLMPLMQDEFLAVDGDGLPMINSRLVRPLTKLNSGKEGTLVFPQDLFYVSSQDFTTPWSYLIHKLELRGFNLTLHNLDTIVQPLRLLKASEPHVISNTVTVGQEYFGPVNVSLSILLDIQGTDDSPLDMRHEIDITVSVPSTNLVLDVLAKVDEEAFVGFALNNVANVNCWLATIPFSEMEPHLALSKMSTRFRSFALDANCVSCSDTQQGAISELLRVLSDADMPLVLRPQFQTILNETLWEFWEFLNVNELLRLAPKRCPGNPEFDPLMDKLVIDPSDFAPPRSIFETAVSLGKIVLQSFAHVTAQHHLSLPSNRTSNPLSAQESFKDADSDIILDWTNPGQHLGGGDWAGQMLDTARDYLGSVVDSFDSSSGEKDLGANILARTMLLDQEGMYTVDLDNATFDVAGYNFSLASVRIHGLDTLDEANVLEAIGPQTLQNRLVFKELQVMLDVTVVIPDGPQIEESMTLSFAMKGAALDLAFLLAINVGRLGDLPLGSMLVMDEMLNCIMSSVDQVDVTQMILSVGDIQDIVVEGFVSPELRDLVAPLAQATFDAVRSDFIQAMPTISDVTVREMTNRVLQGYIKGRNSLCNSVLPKSDFVDFRDLLLPATMSVQYGGSGNSQYGDLFSTLFDMMNKELGSINEFLGSWTESQSNTKGSLVWSGDLLNTTGSINVAGLNALIEFKLSDVLLENLDSFGEPLKLIHPEVDEPYLLNNTASIGVESKPLRISGRVLFALSDDADLEMRNELNVQIELSTVRVFVAILLKIAEDRVLPFPLEDIVSYNCWLAALFAHPLNSTNADEWDFESLASKELSVEIARLNINVSCVSCTSPDFDSLVTQLYSQDGEENATSFVNNLIDQGSRLIGSDFFREKLLDSAAQQCPHNPSYDPNATTEEFWSEAAEELAFEGNIRGGSVFFTVANSVFAVILCFMVLIWKLFTRRRNRLRFEAFSRREKEVLSTQEREEQALQKFLNANTKTMFRSTNFPRRVRYAVPFVLLVNMGLFLGGHFGIISTVDIVAWVAGESVRVNRFLDFAFVGSTIRTYNTGGSELAILVVLFSGLWPYIKLGFSMILFFMPPARLSVSRRGTILLWLDVFAKLSIIDIFFILVAIGALLIYAGGPEEKLPSDGEPFFVRLVVTPRGGFYAFLIAQRMTRIISRFLLDYHRKIVSLGTREYKHAIEKEQGIDGGEVAETWSDDESIDGSHHAEHGSSNEREGHEPNIELPDDMFGDEYNTADAWNSRRSMTFASAEPEKGIVARCRNKCRIACCGGSAGLVFTGITVFSLGIIGIILAPAISIETKPFWNVVENGNTFEEAVSEYTVFRIFILVLSGARFILDTARDYVGLGLLLVVAIVSAMMFPMMQIIRSLRRWLKSRKQRKNSNEAEDKSSLATFLERRKAWKYVEVYVFAFIIACWQLGAMSLYAIHWYCEFLARVYGMLVYVGIVEESSAQCFRLQASHPSTLLIIFGAFLLLLVVFLYWTAVQIRRNKATAINFDESAAMLSIESKSGIVVEEIPSQCNDLSSPSELEDAESRDIEDDISGPVMISVSESISTDNDHTCDTTIAF